MDMTTQGKDYEYATLMNMLHVSVSKHLLDEHFTMVWANSFYYDLIGYPKEEYEALYHNHCDTYYVNDALGIHDDKELAELTDAVMKALSTGLINRKVHFAVTPDRDSQERGIHLGTDDGHLHG